MHATPSSAAAARSQRVGAEVGGSGPGVFLRAQWRWLAMLNYEIDASVLRPLVPRGTELDLWRGRALVSVVGFRFERTRVLRIAIPFHRDFEEVNLRFYVRREHAQGVRRGVVFVRELVPRAAIAWVARCVYGEPYLALPMSSAVPRDSERGAEQVTRGTIEYRWRHAGREQGLSMRARGEPRVPPPDSEAGFIAEHYWGYGRGRGGRTVEYEVEHPAWRVWDAEHARLDADVGRLYGKAFEPCLAQPPCSAFLAEGSPIAVRRPRWL
jgi:uncharacterized protein YqjF (DUF2071 family)